MIRDLLRARLTARQFGVVLACSALACVLIIATAHGSGGPPPGIVAMLDRQPIIHQLPAAASSDTSAGTAGVSHSDATAAGTSSGAGSAASATVTTTPTSDGGSAATGSSSTGTGSGGGTTGSTGASGSGGTTPTANTKYAGKVKHVFVIALTTPSYDDAFGKGSAAAYLNGTLRKQGALLSGYHSLTGAELPDELAMVSGQAPNDDTRANCAVYNDFPGKAKPDAQGDVAGNGCVYPNTAITLGDQVTGKGDTWRAYIDDMGRTNCIHPNSGAHDDALLPFADPQYDTRHNPFIYFHSLLDLGDCSSDDMDLDTALPAALKQSADKAPLLSYIAPDLCADAASSGCPDGQPGGVKAEDAFLKTWVPKILASPAYKDHGVLMITFAASHAAGQTGANLTAGTTGASGGTGTSGASGDSGTSGATGATALTGVSGSTSTSGATGASGATGPTFTPLDTASSTKPVRTGMLVISSFAHAGATVTGSFDPYSVLLSIEDLLGYTPLAHAAQATTFIPQALPGV